MELIFQPGSPSECLRVTTASDSAIEQEEEQLRLRLYTDEDRVTFNPETTLINIIDDGKFTFLLRLWQFHIMLLLQTFDIYPSIIIIE